MASIEEKFGAAVRKFREKKGYTQEEFADLIETERSYYGGIERGIHNPSLRKISQIISALNVRWATLFRHLDKK